VELDQRPHRSRNLLQLPPYFKSFPSKRHRFIRHGTHTSSFQTCDSSKMSTEANIQNTGSPSTPIPTVVNGTPSTPMTTTNAASEAPIIIMDQPIINAQYLASNPFGSLGYSLGYNF
jgi:hypothetical protein